VSNEKKGGVCLRYGCNFCCIDTKMPLTKLDIKRICDLGYQESDFVILIDGEKRIRNVEDECFFLKENKCNIYPYRPVGCRIYPLVLYEESGRAVIDTDCPYHDEFQKTDKDVKKLMEAIREIRK
jgi:hypothetical protein